MVVAMGFPLLVDSVRRVAFRSFRGRRHLSVALLLAGFLLPWVAGGVLVVALRSAPIASTPAAVAVAFAAAAVWSRSSRRARAVAACHAHPVFGAFGWSAARDVLRVGTGTGARCVLVCGPMMLGCALAGHALLPMVGCAALAASERTFPQRRTWAVTAGALALSLLYAVPAVLSLDPPVP